MERTARAARGSAYQDVLTSYQEFLTPIAVDGELAVIFLQGLLDCSQLDDVEFFRFNWMLGGHLTNMDNAFYQRKDGVVSDERWEIMQRQLRFFVSSPGFAGFWEAFEHSTLAPEFVEIVESEMANLDETNRIKMSILRPESTP